MKTSTLLALGLIAIVATGCQPKVDATLEVGSVEEAPAASIVGVWHTDCIDDGSDSYIKTFEVKDGVLTIAKLSYFGNEVCDQSALSMTFIQSGALTITGDSASVTDGKNYQLQLTAEVAIAHNQQTVDMLNSMGACGLNWALNQSNFLFGCIAGNNFDMSQVTYGTVHYGVFSLVSSVTPNYVQFEDECKVQGYQGICPTEQDRPSTLSGTVYFREQ